MKESSEGFLKTPSGITTIVFFLLQFLWYLWNPSILVPIWVVYIVIIFAYIICIVIYTRGKRKKQSEIYRLPKVLSIAKHENVTFILEKNDLLSYSSLVTICYQNEKDDYEIVLGSGIVETIHTNGGNMQVIFYKTSKSDEAQEIIAQLENNSKCTRALRIKPSIRLDELGG